MSNVFEAILDKDNLNKAYTKVVSNKVASGVDGISVDELKEYLDNNWETIENQITSFIGNFSCEHVKIDNFLMTFFFKICIRH